MNDIHAGKIFGFNIAGRFAANVWKFLLEKGTDLTRNAAGIGLNVEAVGASPALSRDAQDVNSYKERTLGDKFDEIASELQKGRYSI